MKKLLLSACVAALVGSSALAADVTCQVSPSTGTISGLVWTSSSTPTVTLTLSGGNLNSADGALVLGTSSEARTVTIGCSDATYYVSAISMDVTGNLDGAGNADVLTVACGEQSITTSNEVQTFSAAYNAGAPATFTITPSVAENKKICITNVVVTLSEETGTRILEANLTNGTYNNGTGWSSIWTSNDGIDPHFTITASAANMGRSDGVFDFRSGQSKNSTYTIATTSEFYYISGFSFKAKMGGTDTSERSIRIGSNDAVVLTSEDQEFSATVEKDSSAVFTVEGENQPIYVSDFQVVFTRRPSAEIAAVLMPKYQAAKGAIDLWRPILGEELYNQYKQSIADHQLSDENDGDVVAAGITAVEALNAPWLNEANGRIIYIKAIRRSEANGKYLTANKNNNHANTKGSPEAHSNWVIDLQGSDATFKLFNPEKNKYIGKANNNTTISLCETADAAIFDLVDVTNQNANNGTAFHITNHNGDLALNVNTGTSDMVTYATKDGGSTWTIELAGVPASEITAGKYYRIRSARALAKTEKRSEGSLLGVNTAVENGQGAGDVAIDASRFSGLGTIWKVEESDVEGKYYIRNVATDFEGQANLNLIGKGAQYANVSNNPGKFTFVSQSNSWVRKHPTAVIIKNQDNSHVDVNSGGDNVSTWALCDNNWPNNGGIYFFEEATDYEEIKDAYIAAANALTVNTAELQSAIENCRLMPAFWSEKDVDAALPVLETVQQPAAATTVKEANARPSRLEAARAELFTNGIDDFYRVAENKPFIAWNYGRHATGNANYYLSFVDECSYNSTNAANEKYNVVGTSTDKTELASHWTLEYQGNGKFYIKNYLNNRYAGHNDTNDRPYQTSETEGNIYEILAYSIGEGSAIVGFKSDGWFMHQTNNGQKDYIVHWNAPSANSNQASGWYVSSANDAEHAVELKATSEATRITFSVEGATLAKHDAYGDHHAITVTKLAATAPASSKRRAISEEPTTFALSSEDDVKQLEDGSFALDYNGIDGEPLAEGNYEIVVPTAAFKTSNGKVTSGARFSVAVDSNGNVVTTGIEEVKAPVVAPVREGIYDLQGRRVNNPTRGLYIVNGKVVMF